MKYTKNSDKYIFNIDDPEYKTLFEKEMVNMVYMIDIYGEK